MDTADQKQKIKAKNLARVYAQNVTNEQGDTYARLWETPEFKEAFDYGQGYEKKNMLRFRIETIFRHTRKAKQLFQKVYYYPNLLEDDEVELRKRFLSESGSHDLRSTFINWGTAASYFPVLYVASRRFTGWSCVLGVSVSWYLLYRQAHTLNDNLLQSKLNSFANPLIAKYKIIDHHD